MTTFQIDRPGSTVGITTTEPVGSLDTLTIADFDEFTCQITSAALTPSQGGGTETIPGTFCQPAQEVPVAQLSTWTVDLSFLQDPNIVNGITAYLARHDGERGWVYVASSDLDDPPKAIAEVILGAGAWGGQAQVPLTATVSFRVLGIPELEVGDAAASELVRPFAGGTVSAALTGIDAAGEVTVPWPAGVAPASAAELDKVILAGAAAPAWSGGAYVTVGGAQYHWDGAAWASGPAT